MVAGRSGRTYGGCFHPAAARRRNPEANAQFLSKLPAGRWGDVKEVGQLALYLCSEDAGFITGTDILIDGGWTAQ